MKVQEVKLDENKRRYLLLDSDSIYHGLVDFPYQESDYVTIVVMFWTAKEGENDIYYHGHITDFDEERDGFWARLDVTPQIGVQPHAHQNAEAYAKTYFINKMPIVPTLRKEEPAFPLH